MTKSKSGPDCADIPAKPYLVRGIDPIPDDWEYASGMRAMRGLYRSRTVLKRLIGNAVEANQATLARDLRGILTTTERTITI
jgi:hypothetical protein